MTCSSLVPIGVQIVRLSLPVLGVDALALDIVREVDHGRLRDVIVRDQRALDFRGARAVAVDIDVVVDAAGDPGIGLGAAPAAGTRTTLTLVDREIGPLEAGVIACLWPGHDRVGQRLPVVSPSSTLPSASTISGATPKNGCVSEAGFSLVAPGSGLIRMPPASVALSIKPTRRAPTIVPWKLPNPRSENIPAPAPQMSVGDQGSSNTES